MGVSNHEGTVNRAYEGDLETNGDVKKKSSKVVANGGETEEPQAPSRDNWDNPIEFLLSCISMSVGLGNVWRFPFTAYENGGGAFLIPYIIVLIFVGKPLYYMELSMGQFASYGQVKVWDVVPAFRGVGYGQAIATWCVLTYYVSLMALTIYYFFASFSTDLPWSSCPINATNCIDRTTNLSTVNISVSKSAAEFYFQENVLRRHPNGLDDGIFAPEWRLALCLLFSWILLFLVLVKGVKSSGKSAYFTALFPYVVLFILLGRGASLPGAVKGIKYFITPQWEKLLEPSVWYAAVSQSFFSLNVGFGSIIMYASYNKFRHNVYRDAAIISVTDTLTSLLAGFTIFAILGHLAELMGVDDIDLVIKGGGSGLAFVSYPDVLARFDWVPQLFAVLFFLMLFTLGIGSASALAGSIITIICDEFPYFRRSIVTLIVCVCAFGMGLFYVTPQGSYILDLIDYYGGTFVVYILAFLEVIAIQWVYGYFNFIRDLEFMLKRKTGYFWAFCWVFFIPVLLFVIFCYVLIKQKPLKSGSYIFGAGANGVGIFITVIAILMLPICLTVTFIKNKRKTESIFGALKKCFQPTSEWSPKDPILRREYREFCEERVSIKLTGIDNLGACDSISTSRASTYPDVSGTK